MFNYIKETILNSIDGVITDNNLLVIKRAGNYDPTKVVDKKVYKTAGIQGSPAVVKLTVGTLDAKVYRVRMFVSTPTQRLSDYAFANWAEFGKPVMVEFQATGTAATDAKALAAALKLALQSGNELYKVTVSDAVVTITMSESWMQVDEVVVEYYDETTEDYVVSTKITSAITANKAEFATGKWLVENLRFPSYPNVRYNALYADEAPVRGSVYTQFAFEYHITKAAPGGLSGVSQVVESTTTHVFYVPSTLADSFETKLEGLGLTVSDANLS